MHDWLTGMRGGEKVLEALCGIFPEADIFTIFHVKGTVSQAIESHPIKTSFIQRLPFAKKRYRMLLPLFPAAVEGLDLRGYDLIVSTSHCAAKGVIPHPGSLHICYIFTPMRYIWDQFELYFGEGRTGFLSGRLIRLFANYLRIWDVTSSARVDEFVAISGHVAKRVEKYYRRDSTVIYPPVDCNRFKAAKADPNGYYLIVSAFAPYKRIDLAIDAFNDLGLPLKITGTGQDEQRLKRKARKNIEFLGWAPDERLQGLYEGCKALVFPGEEDFGIVPLEAMASGRPVIAFAKGGALETVVPVNGVAGRAAFSDSGPTGVFFYEQTTEALKSAINILEKRSKEFNPALIRGHALNFDAAQFKCNIRDYIMTSLRNRGLCYSDAKKTQPAF